MVRHALKNHQVVMMPVTDNSRAGQHMHILSRMELIGNQLGMIARANPVNHARREIGNAAECRVFIGKHDSGARCSRSFGGSKASQSAPYNQHIAMHVDMLVSIRITAFGRPAKPRGFSDQRLIDMFPETLRPHECLVIEAARNKARDLAVEGANVEDKRRPAILTDRMKAIENFNLCGPQIGFVARPIANTHQRIHLF